MIRMLWSHDPAVGGGCDAPSRLVSLAPKPPSGPEIAQPVYFAQACKSPLCARRRVTRVLSDVSPLGRDGTVGTVAAAVRDLDQCVQQPPTNCLQGSSSRFLLAVEPPPPSPAKFVRYGAPDHEPHRVRVTGVSSAQHEDVGGHLAYSTSSPGSTGPGPRARWQEAPRYI